MVKFVIWIMALPMSILPLPVPNLDASGTHGLCDVAPWLPLCSKDGLGPLTVFCEPLHRKVVPDVQR